MASYTTQTSQVTKRFGSFDIHPFWKGSCRHRFRQSLLFSCSRLVRELEKGLLCRSGLGSNRSIRWRMLQIFCELCLAKKGAPPGCVWNRQPVGLLKLLGWHASVALYSILSMVRDRLRSWVCNFLHPRLRKHADVPDAYSTEKTSPVVPSRARLHAEQAKMSTYIADESATFPLSKAGT